MGAIFARTNTPGAITWPGGVYDENTNPGGRVVIDNKGGGTFHLLDRQSGAFFIWENLGQFSGQTVFATASPSRGFNALYNLLANDPAVSQVATMAEARANAPFWTWLQGLGRKPIRQVSDNAIVGILPDRVVCGQNPLVVGLGFGWDFTANPVYIDG